MKYKSHGKVLCPTFFPTPQAKFPQQCLAVWHPSFQSVWHLSIQFVDSPSPVYNLNMRILLPRLLTSMPTSENTSHETRRFIYSGNSESFTATLCTSASLLKPQTQTDCCELKRKSDRLFLTNIFAINPTPPSDSTIAICAISLEHYPTGL